MGMNLYQVAEELSRRLTSVFLRDGEGRRPEQILELGKKTAFVESGNLALWERSAHRHALMPVLNHHASTCHWRR